MPRAPVAGKEIRRRSRNGCWNCKARKVKCGEEKPRCSNCERLDEDCDYKIRLSWGGRPLKKKLLENGGSGQDSNADDPSQFIPGAGQFPLNQHFPSPQTFVQATPSNGTRKPPIPRVGNGKKTSMSIYQTVFSVAEPSGVSPPVMPPPPPSAPVDPRLSVPTSRPHPQRPPPLQSPGSVQHQNQSRSDAYSWQSDITPTTPTPSDSHFKSEQQQQPIFSYTPNSSYSPIVTGSYQNGHHLQSPTTGPPSMVTSPTTPYGGPHGSPPLRFPQPPKAFHSPPAIVTSPTKRLRTSPSPDMSFARPSPSTLSPHMAMVPRALDYSLAPMSNHMGRADALRLENILIPALSDEGSYIDPYSFKRQDVSQDTNELYAVSQREPDPYDVDDDSDIEIINRDGPINYNNGNSMMMIMPAMGRGGYSNNGSHYLQFYPTIPPKLDPLPGLLRDDRRNMMYFDHYLKHTARLLVPHDCSENPFKSILPQMAVQKDHLMNLLLAYSASHRARLLDRPEPTERIGQFLDETIQSLHASLGDPVGAKSDSTLATAIMLSSYQIISPNPLSIGGLTWQTHLSAARKIILSRGGAEGMHSRDKVSYFLVRWFAYLDLLGSLSGRDTEEPVFSGKYWTNDDGEDEAEEYLVDCFFGFTSRCVSILAKIGALARRVEVLKREYAGMQEYAEQPDRGLITPYGGIAERIYGESGWTPDKAIFEEARALQLELEDARGKAVGRCTHTHHRGEEHSDPLDNMELLATNDSFHWAALIHLYRRVLNFPPTDKRVQTSVAQIVLAMAKVRQGGTAENCLLFPLFSAGCEALDPNHREYTRRRMVEVERSGLVQVKHARILMERVWAEHKPWWEIASGEFIG